MLGLPFSGKLEKLTILAYNKVSDDGIPLSPPIPFPVMFNPDSLEETLSRTYQPIPTSGQGADTFQYIKTNSSDLIIGLVFDATGASINSPLATAAKAAGGVDILIELFKLNCFGIDNKSHSPRFLTLVWGTFIFSCLLKTYKVKYELFAPNGRPLRATVTCTFTQYRGKLLDALLLNRNSPDLTHTRVVQAGDTLYNIAEDIYGDPKLYLEIARVNNINNPRSLKTGDVLVLPPINENVA